MAFTYKPIFQGDFYDVCEKFAKDADERLAMLHEANERAKARENLWQEVIALGWTAMMVPETQDGLGGDLTAMAEVLEGCGRAALPLPVLAACAVAPMALNALGGDRKAELLGQLAIAEAIFCPVLEPLADFKLIVKNAPSLKGNSDGNAVVLNGDVLGVEAVMGATHYLVACFVDGEPSVLLCATGSEGVSSLERIRMDGRTSWDLHFDNVSIATEDVLSTADEIPEILQTIFDQAAILACVETVASIGSVIEQSIEYLSERKQFGVALSTFQVLRHYVADMYVMYENLRALVQHVVREVSANLDLATEKAAMLKLYVADVSKEVSHTAIQIHGGMGVTEELNTTRFAKCILMADYQYGDGTYYGERLLATQKLVVE